jgi:riboflavin kinase/FMN adenylyltransferase
LYQNMTDFIKLYGNPGDLHGIPFITAIGVFDGVHCGHRKIIAAARRKAAEKKCRVMALSFSPHPRTLLNPSAPPELLIPESRRAELLMQAGADACAFINFTPGVAALPPETFLQKLQDNPLFKTAGICVGTRWRFGRAGSGSCETLELFCNANGISLDAVDEETLDGEIISSSAIRRAISAGNLQLAQQMLGRRPVLSGKVVHGFQLASGKLSAPTANLETAYGVLPPDGVYSGCAAVDSVIYPAALNIGFAPTFGKKLHRVEIHLIGYSGELYGSELTVELGSFIRPERRFDSPDELKMQIISDLAAVKRDFSLQKL